MPNDDRKPKDPTQKEREIADDALLDELGDMFKGTETNKGGGQTGGGSTEGGSTGGSGS